MTSKRIRLIYSILLSAALILAGLCLMGACYDLYTSGMALAEEGVLREREIYSPRRIAQAFRPIAVPVYVALALTVGSIFLNLFLSAEKEKRKISKNEALILRRLHEKNDIGLCGDAQIRSAVHKEQKLRRVCGYGCSALLAVGAIASLFYFLRTENFPREPEITGAMVRASLLLAIVYGVILAACIAAAYIIRSSIRRELSLMRLVAAPRKSGDRSKAAGPNVVLIARLAVLGLGLALMLLGYTMDGWDGVVTKATQICRECVGLG